MIGLVILLGVALVISVIMLFNYKNKFETGERLNRERIAFMEKRDNDLTMKFQNISNQIIQNQNKTFDEQQKKSLNVILSPFKEQLNIFQTKIVDVHKDNISSKASFEEQFKNLMELNKALSDDAQNLTDALKGNKKLQGNWGEFQLENILELSGLKKDFDFFTQETFHNEENEMLRPDFKVRLPNERFIFIDSKVSLNNYAEYAKTDDEAKKKSFMEKHIQAIKNHITELADKEYQKLLKNNSLDYVIMFIPIESAYIDAVNYDKDLYELSYKKNIMIATPSSLFPILRAVENLWNIEKRNKNVDEIARLGGSLYDKLTGFVEDMKKIDNALDSSKKSYENALNKLSSGKGNAISVAEKLKALGAKTTKSITTDLIEAPDEE